MFIVSQQRKKYTPEYRREAANLVIESERPIAHVAKEIGVSAGLLGRWVKLERCRFGVVGTASLRSWYRCSAYPVLQGVFFHS